MSKFTVKQLYCSPKDRHLKINGNPIPYKSSTLLRNIVVKKVMSSECESLIIQTDEIAKCGEIIEIKFKDRKNLKKVWKLFKQAFDNLGAFEDFPNIYIWNEYETSNVLDIEVCLGSHTEELREEIESLDIYTLEEEFDTWKGGW